jgi:hypothetical protein
MSDKLSVSIWGASLSAEGLVAIVAAVLIVGVLALVVLRRAQLVNERMTEQKRRARQPVRQISEA